MKLVISLFLIAQFSFASLCVNGLEFINSDSGEIAKILNSLFLKANKGNLSEYDLDNYIVEIYNISNSSHFSDKASKTLIERGLEKRLLKHEITKQLDLHNLGSFTQYKWYQSPGLKIFMSGIFSAVSGIPYIPNLHERIFSDEVLQVLFEDGVQAANKLIKNRTRTNLNLLIPEYRITYFKVLLIGYLSYSIFNANWQRLEIAYEEYKEQTENEQELWSKIKDSYILLFFEEAELEYERQKKQIKMFKKRDLNVHEQQKIKKLICNHYKYIKGNEKFCPRGEQNE